MSRKYVKDYTPSRASAKEIRREAKAARNALRAAKAADAPSRMDFEMAVQAAVMKQKARSASYVDLAQANYALTTTGSIVLVATMAQGVSVNQRVGKKAAYKSVQIRGEVQSGTAGTLAAGAAILVYDRKPTNALPAITDILVTANNGAFLNDVNSDRFQIVRRWDWVLTGNSTTPATGGEYINFDEYVDLKKRAVEFNAAGTGAIGDIAKGALYFVTVGNIAAGATAGICTASFRTRFFDVEG